MNTLTFCDAFAHICVFYREHCYQSMNGRDVDMRNQRLLCCTGLLWLLLCLPLTAMQVRTDCRAAHCTTGSLNGFSGLK